MSYHADVYRRIAPVETNGAKMHRLDGVQLEAVSSKQLIKACLDFSTESNDASGVDSNLYFIVYKADAPIAYGSPIKKKLEWHETSFHM